MRGLLWIALSTLVMNELAGMSIRSMPLLAEIIYITTDRNPMNYLNYGCFCGKGGRGTPVDQADRCCKAHDEGYGALLNQSCNPYMDSYQFDSKGKSIKCVTTGNSCSDGVCQCDLTLAYCLAESPYNEKYHNMRNKC